jgi:hypothetical protein
VKQNVTFLWKIKHINSLSINGLRILLAGFVLQFEFQVLDITFA